METTFEEDINTVIQDHIKGIQEDKAVIEWHGQYKQTCDEVVMGMYERPCTETEWRTKEQREAWLSMPADFRKHVVQHSSVYTSGPMPMKEYVRRLHILIPRREEIVRTLQEGREEGTLQKIWEFSTSESDYEWYRTEPAIKRLIRETFVDLCQKTIAYDQGVYFVHSRSPAWWKALTKQWLQN
jgi:hypothetical protein